ncbi:protein-tyrosine phosphatase-like protein [Pisolithus albus]|nr:protein-tyrosine phosphatase-like protein [Pisolithus albus]
MGGPSEASKDSASLVPFPSLYLGPLFAPSSKLFLSRNSITHVLRIGASPFTQVDGVVMDAACNLINKAISSMKGSGKILIHCSAGISRSPMVVAASLMKRDGMSLKEARPRVSPNAGLLQQLKNMKIELYWSVTLEVDELPKGEEIDWPR